MLSMKRVKGRTAALGVLMLALMAALCFLLLPTHPPTPGLEQCAMCQSQLRTIALALQNYSEVYGCYPPPYVVGGNHRPLFSWRVLLIPFLDLGEEDCTLFEGFRWDEPWNSPHNLALARRMPAVYWCPAVPLPADTEHSRDLLLASKPMQTPYLMVTGPGSFGEDGIPRHPESITDAADATLVLVEVRDPTVIWTAPEDFNAIQLAELRINSAPAAMGSHHPWKGANVVLADGTVTFLHEETSLSAVHALTTVAGGETVLSRFDDMPFRQREFFLPEEFSKHARKQ